VTRVVWDANVFASGALGFARDTSTPGAILRAPEIYRFRLLTSTHLTDEAERTLESSYFAERIPPDVAQMVLRMLREFATQTPITAVVSAVATHPADALVLATAVSAAADCLVTGDRQLQRLGSYEGVAILSPREFLAYLDRLDQDDEVLP
jgi:putative PIN family toxin of toxin-antitoxin system